MKQAEERLIVETGRIAGEVRTLIDAERLHRELDLAPGGLGAWFRRIAQRAELVREVHWVEIERRRVGGAGRRKVRLLSLEAAEAILTRYEGGRVERLLEAVREERAREEVQRARSSRTADALPPVVRPEPVRPAAALPDPPSGAPVAVREEDWDGRPVLAVDARELHRFLEVGKRFASWLDERFSQYGFLENQDYRLLPNFGKQKGRGGHNRKEYALTLDMAKELSMVERNQKGREARRYFIECEKALLERSPAVPNQLGETLKGLQALIGQLAESLGSGSPR